MSSKHSGDPVQPGQVATGNAPLPAWETETNPAILAKLEEIGGQTVPILEELAERLPALEGALLCTADGYNLCALGLEEYQVGRLAAMISTLFSVSNGAMEAVHESRRQQSPLEQVMLQSGDTQLMIYPVEHEQLGYLLLTTWAQQIALGEFLMEARITGRKVSRAVQLDDV